MVSRALRFLVYGIVAVSLVVLLTAQESSCGGETSDDRAQAEQPEDSGENGDTGRMSEGEFETFSDYDLRFADEMEDWSRGYATCARIGQTGDLAGFRDCIEEEWKGVEDAGLLAYANARDTLGDVANECQQVLATYMNRVDELYTRNSNAYDAAKSLDPGSIAGAFKGLARYAKRYAAASASTRDGCKPS